MTDVSRRRALALVGSTVAVGVAGCGSGDGDESPADGSGSPADTDGDAGEPGSTGETDRPGTTATGTGSTDEGAPRDGEPPTDGDTAPADAPLDELSVSAERVVDGFTSPVDVQVPRSGRLFVVDQPGRIHLHDDADGLRDEPFLDVSDRMVPVSGYTEQGLLGLAFHPRFADNGRLFVRYSAPRREGTPESYSHTFVLAEFRADPGADRADPGSERTILEIPQPQGNHNAGDIAFGPDGYLYVAVGDGGGANDAGEGHADDWYDATDGGNGQDVTGNLLGSVLRIDVDDEDGDRNYAVPEGNPLVGADGFDEQYAWGLRNPWRFSFGPDGRLFAADVGQGAYEEINVVESGGNYGWNVREGTHCFGAEDCPDESPDGRPLRDPVIEYPHGGAPVSGISVIGGHLYHGEGMPDVRGRYLFADWQANGRLFVAEEADDGLWPTAAVPVDADGSFGQYVLSFGEDPDGELFVCTTAQGQVDGDSGAVYRLRSAV